VRPQLTRAWLALPACMLAVALSGCGSASDSASTRLGHDLAEAMKNEGRVECTSYAERDDLWTCAIEGDPGSGWSGRVLLKADNNGCWRARYAGYKRNSDSTASRSDSFGGFEAVGRTFKGCTDVEG
jgi:hypothetical protein